MRKVIKIIIGILIVIAIILTVAWLRARHAAQQTGTPAPSFRQFLGLGTVTPPKQTTDTGTPLTADFTQTDTTGTADGGTAGPGATTTSQFTSGPISPTQSNTALSGGKPLSSSGTISGGALNSTSGTLASSPATPPATSPANAASAFSQCTDADLTINFTPDEIKELNALQNRFYAIAGSLHTDGDVQAELSNHDQFKAKADQITELYNYCVAQSPKITAPLYSTRITTPFWRDANRDGAGYWWNRPNGVTFIDLTASWNTQDPQNPMMSQASIEQIFRLNLW